MAHHPKSTLRFLLWMATPVALVSEAQGFPQQKDPGGCALEQITSARSDEDGNFQFHGPSRDGHWLVVGTYAGKAEGAYLLNLQSGERRDLPEVNNGGALSEDASRILVAVHRSARAYDVVEHTIATGAQAEVAPDPAPDFLATYSPDGRWILFNSYRTGKSDIYVVPRAGGEPTRLTDFDGYDAHADFAPDTKHIVFHRNVGTPGHDDYDIYALDFATKVATPLITGAGEQAYPAWSPDGRWIAYSATSDNGKNDIFVAAFDGTNAQRLTRLPGYNAYPSWSADGGYLYFNDERGGKRNVFRLRFVNGDCVR